MECDVATIDDETKRLLSEQWIPRLRELRSQRKPIFLLMACLLLVPLVAAGAVFVQQFWGADGGLNLKASGISGMLLGVSAIPFVYLGRLQSCNDVLVVVEFSVLMGDRDQLVKSISNISCFGKMQDLMHTIQPFVKGKQT